MVAQDERLKGEKKDYKSFPWERKKIHTKHNGNLAGGCHGQAGRLTNPLHLGAAPRAQQQQSH